MHHHHVNPLVAFVFGYAASEVVNKNSQVNVTVQSPVSYPRSPTREEEKNIPLYSNRRTQSVDALASVRASYERMRSNIAERNEKAAEYNHSKATIKKGARYFCRLYEVPSLISFPSEAEIIDELNKEDVRTLYELRIFVDRLEKRVIGEISNPLELINFSYPSCAEQIFRGLQGVKGFGSRADWYNDRIKEINKERGRRNANRGLFDIFKSDRERIIPRLKVRMMSERDILNIIELRKPKKWTELFEISAEIESRVYREYEADPDYSTFSK